MVGVRIRNKDPSTMNVPLKPTSIYKIDPKPGPPIVPNPPRKHRIPRFFCLSFPYKAAQIAKEVANIILPDIPCPALSNIHNTIIIVFALTSR